MGTHMKDFHLPLHSQRVFFKNWGGPRTQKIISKCMKSASGFDPMLHFNQNKQGIARSWSNRDDPNIAISNTADPTPILKPSEKFPQSMQNAVQIALPNRTICDVNPIQISAESKCPIASDLRSTIRITNRNCASLRYLER